MKKSIVFIVMIAFAGVSSFSFNLTDKDDSRTAEKKTECVTAVAEKASDCSSATNAVLTAGSEKASDCGSATNAVLTAGSEKSADCEDEKAEDTRIAEIK